MVRLGKSLFYQVIMNTEKRFLFLVLFVSVLLACKKKTSDKSIHFFSELIPGSKYHQKSYIDLLLLNGNAADYPFAKNYYVRIPKTELLKR